MSGWVQVFTGRRVYPLSPDPESVTLEDVAHSLSLVCRFQGHCSLFYSVAEHSVHVARLCWRWGEGLENPERARLALLGLLHDAGEAYLADVSRPVKSSLYFNGSGPCPLTFEDVERGIMSAVWSRLVSSEFPSVTLSQIVKRADDALLQLERL